MIYGYIDGSWDLLHAGHVTILQRAAALCDKLIVGVATNELHAQKKGKPPIVSYGDRLEVVKALRCVACAVPHTHLDETNYSKLGISVRFVGTDHGGFGQEQTNGLQWCKDHGVQVVYLPYTEWISTTRIKEKVVASTVS